MRAYIFEAVRFGSACTMLPFIQRPGSRPVGAPRRNKLRVFVHAGIGLGWRDWWLLEDEECYATSEGLF